MDKDKTLMNVFPLKKMSLEIFYYIINKFVKIIGTTMYI